MFEFERNNPEEVSFFVGLLVLQDASVDPQLKCSRKRQQREAMKDFICAGSIVGKKRNNMTVRV